MRYIEEKKSQDCIFCVPAEAESLKDNLILRVTPYSRVMLNKYTNNNGHLMVAPHRHTADLAELPDQEFSDLMYEVRNAVEVLKAVLHPQGVNVGLNLGICAGAGIADHLHWHAVPRWAGDTNFMPVVAAVHVMPQHLSESYDQLRPSFLSSSSAVGGGSN
jgi:ATP adenylyltransferase